MNGFLPPGRERRQALEEDVHVLDGVGEVEHRWIEAGCDLRIGLDELPEAETLLPGPHGVALDEAVGLVPREALRRRARSGPVG